MLNWERNHPTAQLILYSDGSNIYEEKRESDTQEMNIGDQFFFVFSIVFLWVFPLVLLLVFVILPGLLDILQYGIGNAFYGDGLGVFFGSCVIFLVWGTFAHYTFRIQASLEGLYVDSNNLYLIGVPLTGIRIKKIECHNELTIIQSEDKRALMVNNPKGKGFYFMHRMPTYYVNIERLNELIQKAV